MGLEQAVIFSDTLPAYGQVVDLLATRGLTVHLRMIDGMLALPDEKPTEAWQELRISLGGGMITLRQAARKIALVIWGNADEGLVKAWNALTWAWAAAGNGQVASVNGLLRAEGFAKTASFPAGFSTHQPSR